MELLGSKLHLLLFLTLSLLARGSPGSLNHQLLTLIPLQHPRLLSPDDDFLSWTVDPALVSDLHSAVDSSTSLNIELAHRDSIPSVNSTVDELFKLRLGRDAARVETLTTTAAAAAAARNRTLRSGYSSSVVSGLAQGSGEYFTRIGIGTPPSYAFMVVDTGSDLAWLQCSPCRRCYSQSAPIFDPRRSRTYASVPCGSALCRRLDASGCDLRRGACLYEVAYGDGSATMGDFSTETLTFRGGARLPRVALGCGHDNQGLFVAASGLLGLGRGTLSLPSQAAYRLSRRFSYCLVDRTSTSSQPVTRASSLIFGPSAIPQSSSSVAYTPMVRNPTMDTFYYADLIGISVGGARVPRAELKLDQGTGRGGVIIDSGTSVTRLARAAYEAMRDAFRAGATELSPAAEGFSLFDTCYDLGGKSVVKVPTLVLHFAGGADVALPAENYLIPVDTKGTFCFAFAGTDGGVSIIGNIQQQGFRMVFDSETSRIGFVPRGC
ncbi:putative nepenthesin [Dioscorea sansibarensis]